MTPMPMRMKIVGGTFVFIAVLVAIGMLFQEDDLGPPTITDLATLAVFLVAGVGLLVRQRWSWIAATLISLVMLGIGIATFVGPGDIAYPGAGIVALWFLILPGGCFLAALLSPATLGGYAARKLRPLPCPRRTRHGYLLGGFRAATRPHRRSCPHRSLSLSLVEQPVRRRVARSLVRATC